LACQKAVEVDGGEVLVLAEGAPQMIEPASLRKERRIKTAAFGKPPFLCGALS